MVVTLSFSVNAEQAEGFDKERGLTDVTFPNPVPKTKPREMLSDADVRLMILANVPVFHQETSPSKFFEYIALGWSVVNNYPDWLIDMITEVVTGMAIGPDDSKQFANPLSHLAENPCRHQAMGARVWKFAEEAFGRRHLDDIFVEELERLARQ